MIFYHIYSFLQHIEKVKLRLKFYASLTNHRLETWILNNIFLKNQIFLDSSQCEKELLSRSND